MRIPSDRADFFELKRGEDGKSRAEEIADIGGEIRERAEAMGFSSGAEALPLIRALLVVEGSHDQQVVEHFSGDD